MQRAWIYEHLAVTVETIDFLDPALAASDTARERGVRLEVRLVDVTSDGSIYVSSHLRLQPAVCRIDLLESAPCAADRMHWHPTMTAGEPGDRVFDRDLPLDPVAWVTSRFADAAVLLTESGLENVARYTADVAELAADRDDIAAAVRQGLATARAPWPEVDHDRRGLAPVPALT